MIPQEEQTTCLTYDDAIAIARGCVEDYGGGYRHDPEKLEIFRHGMQTAVIALEHAKISQLKDMRTRALHVLGTTAEPREGLAEFLRSVGQDPDRIIIEVSPAQEEDHWKITFGPLFWKSLSGFSPRFDIRTWFYLLYALGMIDERGFLGSSGDSSRNASGDRPADVSAG